MNLLISVGCGMMVVSRQSSRHKMWTEITRPKYEREGQRYASDVTDAEWALAGGQAFGPAARHRVASRAGRDLVHRADRLSVADAAQGLSPVHHGARLFLRLARQRPV